MKKFINCLIIGAGLLVSQISFAKPEEHPIYKYIGNYPVADGPFKFNYLKELKKLQAECILFNEELKAKYKSSTGEKHMTRKFIRVNDYNHYYKWVETDFVECPSDKDIKYFFLLSKTLNPNETLLDYISKLTEIETLHPDDESPNYSLSSIKHEFTRDARRQCWRNVNFYRFGHLSYNKQFSFEIWDACSYIPKEEKDLLIKEYRNKFEKIVEQKIAEFQEAKIKKEAYSN